MKSKMPLSSSSLSFREHHHYCKNLQPILLEIKKVINLLTTIIVALQLPFTFFFGTPAENPIGF